MGRKENDRLREVFNRRLREVADGSFWATVESVDEGKRTCTVSDEGVHYDDVLLYGVEDAALKGFCLIPSPGSRVIVSRLGGSSMLYVSMFSQVESLLLTIQGVSLTVTPAGFTLVREGSGLRKTLENLCDALGRLTVTTNAGPSGIPINKAEFDAIKADLTNYLEG